MKRRAVLSFGTALTALILLCGFSCSPIQNNARDTAAALQGAITAAQAQYQATCTANPTQTPCTAINQAVAAQNLLITATEAYCNWSPAAAPSDPTATCVPVSSAEGALQTAINNATTFIAELKGVIK
jgi:hypothetical protein